MDEESEDPSVPYQFALKSVCNQKYLSFVRKDKELFGYLQFSGDKVVSPYTKFELETSKFGKGFFHIRCCWNNRYWVLNSESSHYIVAGAKTPDEDQSKHTCTLFKPFYDDSHGGFRFKNAHLYRNVHLHAGAFGAHRDSLFAKSASPQKDRSDLVTVVDWDSLCILPRYVAFKGDNGCYVRPYIHPHGYGNIYLQFRSDDISDPGIKHEIETMPDGHILIRNVPYDRYWVHDPDWILVKGHENSANDRHALFWPIKVDNNVVALRSMGNNHICKRLTLDWKENCLNAGAGSINDLTKLEVVELVISREIYNINFHLSDARVYNEKPLMVATGTDENLKDAADKVSVKLSYEDTVTTTWKSSISTKFGVKVTVETGVPKISEGEIEISAEFENEYEWGGTQQMKTLVEVTHDVMVPAWTKVRGSIIATQATCDVPFSYTQRDKLLNGRWVIRRLDDGIFTGVNCYNYQFRADEI